MTQIYIDFDRIESFWRHIAPPIEQVLALIFTILILGSLTDAFTEILTALVALSIVILIIVLAINTVIISIDIICKFMDAVIEEDRRPRAFRTSTQHRGVIDALRDVDRTVAKEIDRCNREISRDLRRQRIRDFFHN